MTDCVVVHIAGAVYSCGDIILFEMLRDMLGQLYMRVTVQIEQIMQETYIFNYNEIPTEMKEIFEYVNDNSFVKNDILYGTHILRKDDTLYTVMGFKKNPIGEEIVIFTTGDAYDADTYKMLARQMKHIKA